MYPTRLLLAIVLAGSACATPSKDSAAKAAAASRPLIPADEFSRQSEVSTGYALVSAMMMNNDARSITGLYAPNAILVLPDSTVRGAPSIAEHWVKLAQNKSMEAFERSSLVMSILDDSTLADSGSYLMTLKRSPKDSVVERGNYQARWRARATGSWVMLEDHIIFGAGKKKVAR